MHRTLILSIILTTLFNTTPTFSHGGEDHGESKPSPQESISTLDSVPSDLSLLQRVFLPQKKQRVANLKAFQAQNMDRPQYVLLPAKVVASPNGYAQVHVPQASRVVADPTYPMPTTGDKVEANQVIAIVEPLVSSVDLTDKKTELYKIEGEIAQLERDVERLTTLGKFSARKKLEDTKTDLESAKKRRQQILTTGLGRELIRAPIAGILNDSHLLPGQIVQPGQPIAEIVDPASFQIEAYTYDYALTNQIKEASLRSSLEAEKVYPLTLKGLSPKVGENDQARHILFSIKETAPALMIGEFVDVMISLPSTFKKVVIPQTALFKNGKNYSVFILAEPALIVTRPVQVGLFFDDKAEILEGLKPGERVIENVETLATALRK
ncbi:MAG: efflux RND transporter periplasmic adaptor subunit [Candidatus Paracaedimonas acanthamoebae]|jgi:cobalt-zinc-cadmium efflux system membrane fusion protein|uniref:Efflux RND transporter periplasmic adaptor subunit n=1 Tax=Candidatus Paracaedimonas acanthamoebae TaxID=244581 RepID=A0A8J7TUD7_9PROT|nr:efflux RND transporter periplasmic adaptor subunit [Candidatus Paracaedimonas acanthamoebae]